MQWQGSDRKAPPPSPIISPAALSAALAAKDPPLLLDVRSSLEQAAGYIAGARLLPLETLEAGAKDLPPGRRLVVYDRVSSRARRASELLRAKGLNAMELEGGMGLWVRQGRPLAAGNPSP